MYLYYLLGWKLMSKYYARWQKGEGEIELGAEVQVRYEKLDLDLRHACRSFLNDT